MSTSFTATYEIRSTRAPREIAEFLADMETTGRWPYATTPTALFESCRGSVASVVQGDDGAGRVEIEFPVVNLNLDEPFQGVWLSPTSGYAPAALDFEARLVELDLPTELVRAFPGPRFGREGIRALVGSEPGELLIGTIVKPVAGLTPEEVADDVRQAARAGVQFVKDDQKMLNPDYCPLERRVELVERALREVEAETGNRCLYAPNVTAGGRRLERNARAAVAAGARAVMVTFMSTGLEAIAELARDDAVDVPIYAHCGGKELMTRGPHTGVDEAVLGELVRLMGGDALRVSALGGDLVHSSPAEVGRLIGAQTGALGSHAAMMPAVSGGLKPSNLHESLAVCGTDMMVLAGRGIAGHPRGIRAGVAAMRLAEEAFRVGSSVEEFARDHAVLAEALT